MESITVGQLFRIVISGHCFFFIFNVMIWLRFRYRHLENAVA